MKVFATLVVLAICFAWFPTDALPVKPKNPRQTGVSCAFPGSSMDFAIFKTEVVQDRSSQKDVLPHRVSPFGSSSSVNADSLKTNLGDQWVIFSSDVNGSAALYLQQQSTSGSVSTTQFVADGASMNDHARFQRGPATENVAVAYTSTRDPSGFSDVGWSALFLTTTSASTGTPNRTIRVSPRETLYADYSPAWRDDKWIAVTRGSGKPNGGNIVIYNVAPFLTQDNPEPASGIPQLVVENAGWPTWNGPNQIIFHRNSGGNIWDRWDLMSVDLEFSADGQWLLSVSEPKTVLRGALTPNAAGHHLAFAFFDTKGRRQIGVMDPSDNTTARQITFGVGNKYNPSYDSTSATMYYHTQPCLSGEIVPNIRRRVSGSSVLGDFAYAHGDFPSISPDGKKISVTGNGFTSIEVMDVDGSNRNIIYNATSTWMTSWVKGNKIAATMGKAFQLANDSKVQVMTINSDGSDLTQLTTSTNQNQGYPCFSPDATKIVYRTNVGMHNSDWPGAQGFPGPYHLQIMDDDGNNARNLTLPGQVNPTEFNLGDTHPHWGPNGTIVFASDRGHAQRTSIWLVNEDGSNLREVFDEGALSVHPSITADGNHIVFTSTFAGYSAEQISCPFTFTPKAEVFTMTISGTELQRVTHDTSENANVWVGSQELPAQLSEQGSPAECDIEDSHSPPGAPSRQESGFHGADGFGLSFVADLAADEVAMEQEPGRPFPHGSIAVAKRKQKTLNADIIVENAQGTRRRCPFMSKFYKRGG